MPVEAALAPAFAFKPAVMGQISLLIGFAGGTGSGKTYSALRMAKGLAGGKRFAVIDTEAGRALHYAREFDFDHGDLGPPFRPESYARAIIAADEARYPVIVVDSTSHEWAGEGGVLDWQEDELWRMAKDDYAKRESCKMAAWIQPKRDHKKMVSRLLQVRAHLILCFRAEPKIEMQKGSNGKWEIVPKKTLTGLDGWVPICEKNLPFELTASFLLTADQPGLPKPIKLEKQHRALIDLEKPVDEVFGQRMAKWAAGGADHSPASAQKPIAQLSVTELISRYEAANSTADLTALESRRHELWAQKMNGGDRAKLKEVSEAAKKRFDKPASSSTSPSFTEESALAAIAAAASLQALDETWGAIKADFLARGQELPVDLKGKHTDRGEALSQQLDL